MSVWAAVVIFPLLAVGIALMVWMNKLVWPAAVRQWREVLNQRRSRRDAATGEGRSESQ